MLKQLFRDEAVAHAYRRLEGNVLVATPLSTKVLSAALIIILVIAVLFLSLASYARKETVPGWIVPDAGLVRITTRTGGEVSTVSVRQGDAVKEGETVAILDAITQPPPPPSPTNLLPGQAPTIADRPAAAAAAGKSLPKFNVRKTAPKKPPGRVAAGDPAAGNSPDAATASSQAPTTLISPIAGKVYSLPTSLGQIVQPGTTIAVVTPPDSTLVAQLLVPTRAIGFVAPGQRVRLMYQAFPYQTYGAGEGTVISVANASLGPNDPLIPGLKIDQPLFDVRVRLDKPGVTAYGKTFPLTPGMLLTADIIIERRSLMQWLFDPLYASGRRA